MWKLENIKRLLQGSLNGFVLRQVALQFLQQGARGGRGARHFAPYLLRGGPVEAPHARPIQQRVEVFCGLVGVSRDLLHVDDNGGPPGARLETELQRGVPRVHPLFDNAWLWISSSCTYGRSHTGNVRLVIHLLQSVKGQAHAWQVSVDGLSACMHMLPCGHN